MKRLRFALALSLALVLTACGSLPTAGPVTEFTRDVPDTENLVLKGFGPQVDADPDVIVRDFLRASAAGFSDDFQVARLYLTEAAEKTWRPETQVQIYSDDQTPNVEGDTDRITVGVPIEAVVTQDGNYSNQATPTEVRVEYGLSQDEDGQWRINTLPDGVLLSRSSFYAVYRVSSVYFLSPDMAALVSDPRWYPSRRLESHLMQALIEGPSTSIASAVVSAIPAGTRLPLQQVAVVNGRAEVQIEGEVPATAAQQSALKWQITATLMQVPTVSEVHIRLNETDLGDIPVPTGPSWAMDTRIGIGPTGLVVNDGSGQTLVVGTKELGQNPSLPTIGPVDSSPMAYVSDGKRLMGVITGLGPIELYTADKLSAPSIDRDGWIWTTAGPNIIATAIGQEEPITMQSPWPSGEPLVSIAISPDGARALLLRSGDAGTLWQAAVKRSADGTPLGLDVPAKVEGFTGKVKDFSWAGNNSAIALLDTGNQKAVGISTLASGPESLRAPADATRISGGATPQTILLGTADENLYMRSGVSWRGTTTDIRGETFPH